MQNFLFFDIECANCFDGVGKICEFGYCLLDEEFNLIEKEDIFINPEGSFHLGGRNNHGITLSKPYDYYRSCPTFEHFYEKIKQLLEDEDNIPFAYGSGNDVGFILTTLKRYNLPLIKFDCYDAQLIAAKYLNIRFPGLEKTYKELCPEGEEVIAHEASNDAFMTAKVVEKIFKDKDINLSNCVNEIDNLIMSSSDEAKVIDDREEIHNLLKPIHIRDSERAKREKFLKKRYLISYQVKNDHDLYVETLKAIHEKKLFLVTNLKVADKVIYIDKLDKKHYKKIIRWPHRKFKFVNVKKFLA